MDLSISFPLIREVDGMKKFPLILIAAGIIVLFFPLIEKTYSSYMQNKYENEFYRNLSTEAGLNSEYNSLDEVFLTGDEGALSNLPNDNSSQDNNVTVTDNTTEKNSTIMGLIIIDKINLKLPIIDGATKPNMLAGIARVKGTSNIGEIGNIGLAGHRSRTYGRFFNRLDEINKGDKIVLIDRNNKSYEYTVYEKLIVKPDNVSVLNRNSKDKILTLITCHPRKNPTHRLIIHCVLK